VLLPVLAACGGPTAKAPTRTPLAEQWFTRSQASYKAGDFEDARDAAKSALQAAPNDPEVRLISARIALARLDYDDAVKLTEGMQSSEGHSIRGRAFWYRGDLEQAADELEAMLQDPDVKDPWAREVAGLARRGSGRHPFAMEGALVAAVEMPSAAAAGPAMIVPCELEGEQVLAMVATSSGEVVVDSSSRKEAAWVNLRFGDKMEVKDVPALTQDLSALSRRFGAPIKMLLGVNLLRHTHATLDRRGDQFVVRKDEPRAPPDSTRVPLWYVRGGGMLVRASVSAQPNDRTPLLVDSAEMYPIALDDAQWKKAGVDVAKMQPVPGEANANVKEGTIPMLKLAGFDLPQIPGVEGGAFNDMKSSVDIDLGGVVGAQLLGLFRVTFGDEGRFMWVEADPSLLAPGRGGPPPPDAKPAPAPMVPDEGAAPKTKPETKKPAATPPSPGAKR
jgi:hypothetical protein